MFSAPFLQETNFLCGAESMVLQFGTFLIKNSSSNGILNQIKHNTLLLFSDAKPQNQQVKLELMFIYKHKGGKISYYVFEHVALFQTANGKECKHAPDSNLFWYLCSEHPLHWL